MILGSKLRGALVWLALITAIGATPRGYAADSFQGIGLCRFLLVDYALPPATEASVNQVVTDSLHKQEAVFGFKASPDFHVKVRIYGRFADFESYTRTNRLAQQLVQNTRSLTNLGGYYAHRNRQIVTWRQRHPSDLANTLLHESCHAILDSAFRRIPIWLAEGSATYFAYPHHLQDDRDVGTIHYRWAKLNVMLRDNQLMTSKSLLNLSETEWMKLDPGVSYTMAWSMFQLLMSTPARQEALRRYVRELQTAEREADGAGVMEGIYPGGVTQLDKDWHDWIAKAGARVLGKDMEEMMKRVR